MNYFIWWLNQPDCEKIEAQPDPLPDGYLAQEFRSRAGRPGRARLWVSRETFPVFPSNVQYSREAETRLLQFEDCGGIVIRPEDVAFCKGLLAP